MVDTSSGRRAKPFNLLWDEWEATKQPVQERGTLFDVEPSDSIIQNLFSLPRIANQIAPVATYEDGSKHLAWPSLLAMAPEGFALGQALSGHDIAANPEIGIPAAVDVAGGAMTGGIAASGLAGAERNALMSNGMGRGRSTLPMDQASRLARAEEMGFRNEPVYHGTVGDIESFDLSRGGSQSRSRAGLEGVSVSPSPDVANEFAFSASQGAGDGSTVLPLRYRSSRQARLGLDGTEKNLEVAATLDAAWDQGFDSVRLLNYSTPGGKTGQEVVVVRNPNQLRSVNAAFDPAMKDSANLLAANSNPSTALALELAKDAANVPAQKGFTAYHGSPHDFDKFDMSKIGTGGGAQDYGHGLYFAENEGIAKQYRDKLSKQQAAIKPAFADTALDMSNGDHAQALAYARRRADTEEDGIRKMRWNAAAEYLDAGRPELDGTGRMYEVRINADPNDFLDWDKPISQQSEKVRGAIEAMGDKALLAKSGAKYNQFDPFTEIKGGDFINSLNRHAGSPYAARMAFDEQGVPGVKYLDENSRTAGDGSRNYVLFRDDIIDIVKKYGVAYAAMMYGEEAVNSAMGTGAAASPGQTDY